MADVKTTEFPELPAPAAPQKDLTAPTFGDTNSAAWQTETYYTAMKEQTKSNSFAVDPAYRLGPDVDAEEWKRLTQDIPQELHGMYAESHSQQQSDWLHERALREINAHEVSARGVHGTMGHSAIPGYASLIGASLLDPVQLVATYATGGIGLAGKVGRLRRAWGAGLNAGVTNMAIEAGLQEASVARQPTDMVQAGVLGFLLGAPMGALSRGENAALRASANKAADGVATLEGVQRGLVPEQKLLPYFHDEPMLVAEDGSVFTQAQVRDIMRERPASEMTPELVAQRATLEGLGARAADRASPEALAGMRRMEQIRHEERNPASREDPLGTMEGEGGGQPQAAPERHPALHDDAPVVDVLHAAEEKAPVLNEKLDNQPLATPEMKNLRDRLAAKPGEEDAFAKAERAAAEQKAKETEAAYVQRENQLADQLTEPSQLKDTDGVEHNPALQSAKNAQEAVDIIARTATDPSYRAIADRLKGLLGGVSLDIVEQGKKVERGIPHALQDAAGVFQHSNAKGWNSIWVKGLSFGKNHGLSNETVLHEAIHAVTARKITLGNLEGADHALQAHVKDLFGLTNKVVGEFNRRFKAGTLSEAERKGARLLSAMRDPRELVAYGMTNPHIQAFLKSVEIGPQATMWTKFVDIVRNLLGLAKEATDALSHLMSITDRIISHENGPATKALEQKLDPIALKQLNDEHVAGLPPEHQEAARGFLTHGIQIRDKTIISGRLLRPSYYARLDRVHNKIIDELKDSIVHDSTGRPGAKTAKGVATEYSHDASREIQGQTNAAMAVHFEEWKKANGLSFNPLEATRQEAGFYKEVTQAVKAMGNDSKFAAMVRKNPQAAALAKELETLMTHRWDEMEGLGVQGIETARKNIGYMMRRPSFGAINSLIIDHTLPNVKRLFAEAIGKAQGLASEKAAAIADAYVNAMATKQFENGFKNIPLTTQVRAEITQMLLKDNPHLDAPTLKQVVDLLVGEHPDAEAGTHARLKNRVLMDEGHSMQLPNKEGVMKTVRIADFYEEDARLLMQLYNRQTSGMVGWARAGYKSWGDVQAKLKEATQLHLKTGEGTAEDIKQAGRDIEDLYNHDHALPMSGDQPFSPVARTLRVVRNYAFAKTMWMSALAQVPDTGVVLANGGLRAFLAHNPINSIFSRATTRAEIKGFQRAMASINGYFWEGLANNPLAKDVAEQSQSGGSGLLARAENAAQWASHQTAHKSGLVAADTGLRHAASCIFTQNLLDWAHGVTEMPQSWDRMRHAGIDEKNWPSIAAGLKKFVKTDADGIATDFDYKGFLVADPEAYRTFVTAQSREARRQVQQHTIADTFPWMNTTAGKVLAQLKVFTLMGWGNNTLNSLAFHDKLAVGAFMHSTIIAGMAYAAQQYLLHWHDPETLQERLKPGEILKGAIAKAPWSSLIPAAIDSTYGMVYGPQFSHTRSSGLPSDLLTGTPAVDVVDKAMKTVKALGQHFLNSDDILTQREANDGLGMIPLLGSRMFIDGVTKDLPKHDPLDNQ